MGDGRVAYWACAVADSVRLIFFDIQTVGGIFLCLVWGDGGIGAGVPFRNT